MSLPERALREQRHGNFKHGAFAAIADGALSTDATLQHQRGAISQVEIADDRMDQGQERGYARLRRIAHCTTLADAQDLARIALQDFGQAEQWEALMSSETTTILADNLDARRSNRAVTQAAEPRRREG